MADVQRVAGVADVQQLRHGRLAHASVVAGTQLAGVGNLPTQIHTRCPVEDVARDGGVKEILGIVHVCGLRLHADAYIHPELTHLIAEHHVGIVVVLVVCGILGVLDVAKSGEQCVGGFVAEDEGLYDFIACHVAPQIGVFVLGQQRVDAVHGAVAVRETALELVANLQVGAFEERFCVGAAYAPVPTLRWILRILVREGLRVALVLVVVDERAAVVVPA